MTTSEAILHLAGAVALLLFATRMVRTGIERAYGARLRRAMARTLSGRVKAAAGGVVVSLALQSASATSLLAMSFVSSGALTTAAGLAVMLGADLGSALAVQILSLDLAWLSPLLLVVGVTLFLATTERVTRQLGRTVVGLGLMLLALTLIRATSADIAASGSVSRVLDAIHSEPTLVFILVAALTWLSHSSVAIVLLIGSLTASGVIGKELAFVAVLGANLGAGLIPMMLALSRPREQQRIPFGNLMFRSVGATGLLPILPLISPWVSSLAVSPMQQIVLVHLGFNVLLMLVFLPTVNHVSRIVQRLLVQRVDDSIGPSPLDNPSHLDAKVIGQPQIALAAAVREVLRMSDWVELMLRESLEAFRTDKDTTIKRLATMDDQIDRMNSDIKHYLIQVSRNEMTDEESQRCMEIASFTMRLEHIGDIVEKNLLQLARKRVAGARHFSDEGWVELTELHARVVANMQLALNVFISGDVDSARQLVEEKQRFRTLQLLSNQRHMERLQAGAIESIDSSPIHLDLIRDLTQINALLCAVAYPILEQSGDLLKSRLKTQAAEGDGTGEHPMGDGAPGRPQS